MKVLKEKYPKGSLPNQKTDGRYMDETIYENLKIMARKIVNDMTFMGVGYSSTLEVGTGKSTFLSQIGEVWTELINELHGDKLEKPLEFTMNNIVFRPKDLIERSFKLPKYSFILLDEWEDSHYWSELGMTLRQFFRKCRQLNLFIMIIIPNFFQLPASYAISRSVFAIDVKFEGEFEKGYFQFYNFERKRQLYVQGKRTYNYKVVQPNFQGRFLGGYGVPDEEYRKVKYEDMLRYDEEQEKKLSEKDIILKTYWKLKKNMPEIRVVDWARGFCVSERTINNWNTKYKQHKEGVSVNETRNSAEIINNLIQDDDNVVGEGKEDE